MWYDTAGSTAARTYAVGATSSWAGAILPVTINNREINDMQSLSTLTIFEIAQ
jgi:hypothetical protein